MKEISKIQEEDKEKKSSNFSDKVSDFFDFLRFIKLSSDSRIQVATKVKNDIITGKLYRMQVFLSSVIAALWLLQNSIAVVIWAMLIAPLLRPINAISFSISKSERELFLKSIRVLFLSIFISILTWFLSAKVVWFTTETTEILARTSPNILDLFIAIFSAMIAVLSLWYTRLSESVAWVAMAASLMPPLAVVWIELYLKNYYYAYGSMMLFLTNLVSIVLIWIVIFWLYWYTPKEENKQKISIEAFTFIVLILVIISIPLFQSLVSMKQKSSIIKISQTYLENILKQKDSSISVSSISIESISWDNLTLDATIKLPEWIDFYDTFKEQLDFELSKKLWKTVDLNVELIRIANLVSSSGSSDDTKSQIYDFIANEFDTNYPTFNLISLEINKENSSYNIKIIFWFSAKTFNEDELNSLEKKVRTNYWDDISFDLVPISIYEETDETNTDSGTILKENIEKEFTDYINQNTSSWITFTDIDVDLDDNSWTTVNLSLDIDTKSNLDLSTFLSNLKTFSDSLNISTNVKIFNYDEVNL